MAENKPDNIAEQAEKGAGFIETGGCACLNLGCLFLILGIVVVVSALLDFVSVDGIIRLAGYIWDSVSNAIVSIIK